MKEMTVITDCRRKRTRKRDRRIERYESKTDRMEQRDRKHKKGVRKTAAKRDIRGKEKERNVETTRTKQRMFNDVVSSSDYVARNGKLISEYLMD
jgi:hypothetical protein